MRTSVLSFHLKNHSIHPHNSSSSSSSSAAMMLSSFLRPRTGELFPYELQSGWSRMWFLTLKELLLPAHGSNGNI
ncbi:hypothetical protein CgunFtcFv8_027658 [Champsocephalus gunnari]|uniref:Uncharacterized protein n=1 Tax=Champsocephalus gunnari TaxID=52237 RepID=A0AAN8I0S3_CHAGU|nr:hypothetical protein CgunFtcFv8_027658 [Champsocephalus gunnari]